MTNVIETKQLQTKRSLERLGTLIKSGRGFPTIRLNDEKNLDFVYRDEINRWVERQRSRYFTREETNLQCVVALRYADPTRPTVRELWQYLQALILKDARMMPGRRAVRFPSYSTFRTRVADLPREFVWKARLGADDGRPSMMTLVSRFDAMVSRQA
ncbi:hypothetical protein GGE45_002546 [Rhizobium aethiopicum]|uniref:Uncharacterized protein n=1 Tax=Rhizobium aethiopicum TaxID=1138170 RepID=A0A7W6MC80_9HYPH|nr:hypothetical protein [Rhizobium aethiopicum]MBB4190045.1 hypothetical protein [Rhizobium aethiopicum]MBB4580216.1 hypothetical protein [Rhizobium aethiopicum]